MHDNHIFFVHSLVWVCTINFSINTQTTSVNKIFVFHLIASCQKSLTSFQCFLSSRGLTHSIRNQTIMDTFGSSGRKKSFIISHSGKFKSKNKKRISITDEIWIGPLEVKSKVICCNQISCRLPQNFQIKSPPQTETTKVVTATPSVANEHHGLSASVVISDKLSSDKNILEPGNQHKADYKAAESAVRGWQHIQNNFSFKLLSALIQMAGWKCETEKRVDISNV